MVLMQLIFFSFISYGQTITGQLFDLKGTSKKVFDMKIEQKSSDNIITSEIIYKDQAGGDQLHEIATMRGYNLLNYKVDQKQTKQKAEVSVKDGYIYFFLEEDDGKTKKTEKEKLKDNTIAPITMFNFVKENWTKLSSGEKLDVRMIVWFRMETVGFELFKVGEEVINGEPTLQLRLKPSNFLIAALVKPVDLWYSKSNQRIVQMKGRVTPKILHEGKYKDFDSYVTYTYPMVK